MPSIDNKTQSLAGQLSSLQTRLGNQLPTKTWRDLRHGQHDRAFVVAGAMKADLLNDLANAVNDSISKGLGLDYFQKQFDSIVAKHGWAHTGERRWRAQVIYGTNMRVSYAAGRLAQLRDPELRALKPFWMYRHSGADHPRLQHKAWDKLCLPADDPWFKTHYPPNGWGCGCSLQAVSARDIARLGGRIEKPPEGTAGIDEGWDYQPGADVVDELGSFARQKAASLPAPLAQAATADADEVQVRRTLINDIRAAGIKAGKEIEYAGLITGGIKRWHKLGGKRMVSFTNQELAQMQDGILVHNHPSSTSLSKPDLVLAAQQKLRTVIAVGNEANIFEATPIASAARIKALHIKLSKRVTIALTEGVKNQTLTALDYSRWFTHIVNAGLDRAGAIRYSAQLDWLEPDWVRKIISEL